MLALDLDATGHPFHIVRKTRCTLPPPLARTGNECEGQISIHIFTPHKGYCVYYPRLRTAYCLQRGMFSFECSLVRLEEPKKILLFM